MSGFTFNGTAITDIFQSGSTTVSGYTQGGSNIALKSVTGTDNLQIKNTNVNFKYINTDLATSFLPYFVESTSSGSATVPSWCTKIQFILIGGGGGDAYGSTYTECGGGGGALHASISKNEGTINFTVGVGGFSTDNPTGTAGSGGNTYLTYNSISLNANGGAGGYNYYENGGDGGNGGGASVGTWVGQKGPSNINDNDTGGENGFRAQLITNDSIQTQIYGRGGSRNHNAQSGYIRIYFCVN